MYNAWWRLRSSISSYIKIIMACTLSQRTADLGSKPSLVDSAPLVLSSTSKMCHWKDKSFICTFPTLRMLPGMTNSTAVHHAQSHNLVHNPSAIVANKSVSYCKSPFCNDFTGSEIMCNWMASILTHCPFNLVISLFIWQWLFIRQNKICHYWIIYYTV